MADCASPNASFVQNVTAGLKYNMTLEQMKEKGTSFCLASAPHQQIFQAPCWVHTMKNARNRLDQGRDDEQG